MASVTWQERTAKDCLKRARDRWGDAWSLLSNEMRRGAICEQIVIVLVAQAEQHPDTLAKLQEIAAIALADY